VELNDKSRRLISRKKARFLTDVSERSQLRIPDFPKPIEISEGRVALVFDEVVEWVDRRIAARDASLNNE
jgi:predicted DNA-binding transcriptional regulator AlpA